MSGPVGNVGGLFQDVSTAHPFGNSLAGQGYNQLVENIQGNPGVLPDPHRTNPNDPKSPNNPINMPPPPPGQIGAPTSSTMPLALSGQAPGNNTSQEDALRNAYLGALKPNYGFTFQGQSGANQFNAVPGAKGK